MMPYLVEVGKSVGIRDIRTEQLVAIGRAEDEHVIRNLVQAANERIDAQERRDDD